MKATANQIYAGKFDSLAAVSPFAAGQLPGYWVILQPGVPDVLLFMTGRSLQAQQRLQAGQQGFYCAFTPLFMPEKLACRIKQLSIFADTDQGMVKLSKTQASAVMKIFELLLAELSSDYTHKLDLMRTYVVQIIHFGLKNAGCGA